MLRDDGNLQALTGGLKLKIRIQHPGVHERTDRGGSYWYFRYWEDVQQKAAGRRPSGSFTPSARARATISSQRSRRKLRATNSWRRSTGQPFRRRSPTG